MGKVLEKELGEITSPLIKEQRGRGLFRSIELVSDSHVNGNDLAYELMKLGLLTKATKTYSLRLAPALII